MYIIHILISHQISSSSRNIFLLESHLYAHKPDSSSNLPYLDKIVFTNFKWDPLPEVCTSVWTKKNIEIAQIKNVLLYLSPLKGVKYERWFRMWPAKHKIWKQHQNVFGVTIGIKFYRNGHKARSTKKDFLKRHSRKDSKFVLKRKVGLNEDGTFDLSWMSLFEV